MSRLTEAAHTLLLRRLAGERIAVTAENRHFFRELVAAGLMEPLSTFLHGAEGNYRPTEAALDWISAGSPSRPLPGLATAFAPRG